MAYPSWSVTIEAEDPSSSVDVNDEALERFVAALEPHAGVVTGSGRRYGATLDVPKALDAPAAIAAASKIFRDIARSVELPEWTVVAARALTHDEQDRELARPLMPELVGVNEAAKILGVTRQRISQLMKASNPVFPRPLQVLKATPVWTTSQIERFGELWVRKSGRPARAVIEVTLLGDGRWEVRHRDGGEIDGVDPFDSKDDAVKWGRVIANLAKPSQLIVHDESGRVAENVRFVKEPA